MSLSSSQLNLHDSLFSVATSPPRRSLLRHHRLLPLYPRKQKGVRCSADRRELFSRIAPVYDNLNDLLSLGQHRIWKKMCVSWSGAKEGDIVLDICCGSGDLTFLLSQKVGSNGEVSAMDFSRKQLVIASTRQDLFWKACYKNIKWIEGDALNLPFKDGYFNAITVGFGLRNLIDKPKAMQEIFRVLKPGSKVSILDFNKSTSSLITQCQEWTLDNVVVPIASTYSLSEEYKYLKSSVAEFLTDEAVGSSDEELSGGEVEAPESHLKGEERDLKEKLLRKYSGYLSSLKQEFSKKKKKGKLPKEARQILFDWWTAHYKWPYPTEADKIALAETTGLDQKQINNWFINQRKRHWKPAENMQFSIMDSSSTSSLFADD